MAKRRIDSAVRRPILAFSIAALWRSAVEIACVSSPSLSTGPKTTLVSRSSTLRSVACAVLTPSRMQLSGCLIPDRSACGKPATSCEERWRPPTFRPTVNRPSTPQ